MSYRKFLAREEVLVLPYLGGAHVEAANKRVTLTAPPDTPGWYEVALNRNTGTVRRRVDAPDLSALPKVRGHLHGARLVREGAVAEPLHLLPADEPPMFSICVARRWHQGALLFDSLDFDTAAEESARRAFEERAGLENVSGVSATLRAAYGYALAQVASRTSGIAFAPAEVRPAIADIAQGGLVRAEAELRRLAAEREQSRREMAELERRRQQQRAREELEAQREARVEFARLRAADAETRAHDALHAAGAELRAFRQLDGGRIEVIFNFMGERFISVADAATLQVHDSGICLGHPPSDREVTLESLPSVIREAIDTDALVILRHA